MKTRVLEIAGKVSAAVLAAAASAVASQIVIPGIVPSLQLALFDHFSISMGKPQFLTLASREDLSGIPAKADIEINRLFCGFSISPEKSCLMRRLRLEESVAPAFWQLEQSSTKKVLLGSHSSAPFISWISTYSGAGGAAFTKEIQSGSFTGYGIICAVPSQQIPVKVLHGNLLDFNVMEPVRLAELRTRVVGELNRVAINVEISGAPTVCQSR